MHVPQKQLIPSCDVKNLSEISAAFSLVGLDQGRSLGSKSAYREIHPQNRFVPNASIFVRCTGEGGAIFPGKIWYGDLDLLKDGRALISVSRLLQRQLFILNEADGCWNQQALTHGKVRKRSVATIWRKHIMFSGPIAPYGAAWW